MSAQRRLIWVRVSKVKRAGVSPRETREGPFSSVQAAERFMQSIRASATVESVRLDLEPLSQAKSRCMRRMQDWAHWLRVYEDLAVPAAARSKPARREFASALFSVSTADVSA